MEPEDGKPTARDGRTEGASDVDPVDGTPPRIGSNVEAGSVRSVWRGIAVVAGYIGGFIFVAAAVVQIATVLFDFPMGPTTPSDPAEQTESPEPSASPTTEQPTEPSASPTTEQPTEPSPSPADGPTELTSEAMTSALIRLDDLDSGYREFDPPAVGANRIQDDEFCGSYPTASIPETQVRRFFARGLIDNPKVYSTVAYFPPGGAEAFIANVTQLAESCNDWDYVPSVGQPPIRQYITRREELGYGDQAYRIVVTGPPAPEIDFIYIRVGNVVGGIAYSVADTGISGDERAEPRVTEMLAEEMSQRLAQLP